MGIILQALQVGMLGILLGGAVAWARGLPPSPGSQEQGAACTAPVPERPEIRWIASDRARTLHDDPATVFVDARPRPQFVEGHISGALSTPIDDGTVDPRILEALQGARTIVAYGNAEADCARSTRLAHLLGNAGLGDVHVLEGGFPGWMERGYPAEAGTCRLCP